MRLITLVTLLMLSTFTRAGNAIDQLLNTEPSPFGVVFEIVESDGEALDQLIPEIQGYVRQLRTRHPKIEIAVVSHGSEQFALTRDNRNNNTEVHKQVQSLVENSDVPVHVCGTHASWFGVEPEDFPDYVDVVSRGPGQVRQYVELGYELIILSQD